MILILIVLGAIGLFIAQNKKRPSPDTGKSPEDITITEIQDSPQKPSQSPIIPAQTVTENKEKTAREAIAVGGEYRLIARKSQKDVSKGQGTLKEAKNEYESGNYETAILLARQAIEEFKSAPKESKSGVYYRVKKHDCLWKIAAMNRHYGKGWLWPRIWEANKKKIKIPQLIYPRQKFFIPKTPQGSTNTD
ncbi:MAG: hypothetical protein A2297_04045 [Elusimicrobia bacterium RIFOXYB2_FULL_48_7]|nr:MAG: hypothetical protein A2297_04045 [Elusimicrobia bacterium RIFOXYB2_FULL_48_7]